MKLMPIFLLKFINVSFFEIQSCGVQISDKIVKYPLTQVFVRRKPRIVPILQNAEHVTPDNVKVSCHGSTTWEEPQSGNGSQETA